MAAQKQKKRQKRTVFGRTWPDLLSDLYTRYGASGLLVVLLVGAIYAFFQFQEQRLDSRTKLERAEQKASEQYQPALTDALGALITAFKEIDEMRKSQLAVSKSRLADVNAMLTQYDEVARKLNEKREELFDAKGEVDEQRALARSYLEKAESALRDAELRKERLKEESAQLDQQVLAAEKELAKLEDEKKHIDSALSDRAANIELLRQNLEQLASQVIIDDVFEESESAKLALTILVEILRNPDQLEPAQLMSQLLSKFAADPNEETREALYSLVGMSEDTLDTLVRANPNYSFWVYLQDNVDPSGSFYFGAVDQADDAYNHVVFIMSDEGRVVDFVFFERVIGVRMPDSSDWNWEIGYIVAPTEGEDEEIPIGPAQTDWSFTEELFAQEDFSSDPVFGNERRVRLLSIDEVQERYPAVYREWSREGDRYSAPLLNIEMYNRSKTFDAARLRGLDDSMPPGLKEAFTRLLNAAVARDLAEGAKYLHGTLDTEILGWVAAMALRPRFRVVDVELVTPPLATQQEASSSPKLSLIVAEYDTDPDGDSRRVEFEFVRQETTDRWVLTDLF